MKRLGVVGLAWLAVAVGSWLARPCPAQDASGEGTLIVEVPEDAKVEINGNLTRKTGTVREFACPGLQPGFDYEYVVRAEVERNGKKVQDSQRVAVQVGQTIRVTLKFPAGAEAKTKEPVPASKAKEPTQEPKSKVPTPKAKEPDVGPKPKGPTSAESKIPLPPSPPEKPGVGTKGPLLVGPETPSGTGKKPVVPVGPGPVGPGPGPEVKRASDQKPPSKVEWGPVGPEKSTKPGVPGPRVPIAHKEPAVEPYLRTGELGRAETAMMARLKEEPRDDEARFSLGGVQFLRAVERLAQSLHRYGFRSPALGIEGLDLSSLTAVVPRNTDDAKPLSYFQARELVREFLNDLTKAEATLAQVRDSEVKLPIHFGQVRLDLDGDGKATDEEALWRIYAKIAGQPNLRQADGQSLVVCFDYGDVFRLRGYCHLMMAACESVLAYDEKDLFERAGNLVFAKPVSSQEFLLKDPEQLKGTSDNTVHLVALAHLVRFPLDEPERLAEALKHLQAAIEMSRQGWKAVLAETDDDCEWVPNPDQQSVIPNLAVTSSMVDSWLNALDEADAVLAGRKLLPYPAAGLPGKDRGINVNSVFTKPSHFDLILWVQGSGVAPYVEKGTLTDRRIWQRLREVFGENLPSLAIWFN